MQDAAGTDPAQRSEAGKAAAAGSDTPVKRKRDAHELGGANDGSRTSGAGCIANSTHWDKATMIADVRKTMKVSNVYWPDSYVLCRVWSIRSKTHI